MGRNILFEFSFPSLNTNLNVLPLPIISSKFSPFDKLGHKYLLIDDI